MHDCLVMLEIVSSRPAWTEKWLPSMASASPTPRSPLGLILIIVIIQGVYALVSVLCCFLKSIFM